MPSRQSEMQHQSSRFNHGKYLFESHSHEVTSQGEVVVENVSLEIVQTMQWKGRKEQEKVTCMGRAVKRIETR